LSGILIDAIIICGLVLSKILEHEIENQVADKAFLIIKTMNSVRDYTNSHAKPELAERLATEAYFMPEDF